MSLSICLLNYNSFSDTIECIDSLLNQTIIDFDIIVVDNCSTNNSVHNITAYFSDKEISYTFYNHKNYQFSSVTSESNQKTNVFLIATDVNEGFSSGNNIAINFSKSYLQNSILLLLNNDTVVDSDFVRLMIEEYQGFQKRFQTPLALGAMEKSYFTSQKTHTGFHYLHLPSGLALPKAIFPSFKYICGACLMTDINAPLLNESYFLYYEDADYSKQLIRNNYKLFTTHKVSYYHKISSSMTDNKLMINYQFESMWKFYKTYYPYFIPVVCLSRTIQYLILLKFSVIKAILSTLTKSLKG